MIEKIDKSSIVKEYMIGNTKIKISNSAYLDKTEEDIKRIIKNVEEIVAKGLTKQMNNKKLN